MENVTSCSATACSWMGAGRHRVPPARQPLPEGACVHGDLHPGYHAQCQRPAPGVWLTSSASPPYGIHTCRSLLHGQTACWCRS